VRALEEDVRTFLDLGLHHTWKSRELLHLQGGTMLKVQLKKVFLNKTKSVFYRLLFI